MTEKKTTALIHLSPSPSLSLFCWSVYLTGVMRSSMFISLIRCDHDMSERVYVVHHAQHTFELNILKWTYQTEMNPDRQSSISTERKRCFKDEYALKSEQQFISSKEDDRKIIYLSRHPAEVREKKGKKQQWKTSAVIRNGLFVILLA